MSEGPGPRREQRRGHRATAVGDPPPEPRQPRTPQTTGPQAARVIPPTAMSLIVAAGVASAAISDRSRAPWVCPRRRRACHRWLPGRACRVRRVPPRSHRVGAREQEQKCPQRWWWDGPGGLRFGPGARRLLHRALLEVLDASRGATARDGPGVEGTPAGVPRHTGEQLTAPVRWSGERCAGGGRPLCRPENQGRPARGTGERPPPPSVHGGTRHEEQSMNQTRCHVTGTACGPCVAGGTEEFAEALASSRGRPASPAVRF